MRARPAHSWFIAAAAFGYALAITVSASSGAIVPPGLAHRIHPTLHAFQLDYDWRFFAPVPSAGSRVTARLARGDGSFIDLPLTASHAWLEPLYFRHLRLYDAVVRGDRPEARRSAAWHLCRRFTGANPVSVQWIVDHQMIVDAAMVWEGVDPNDPIASWRQSHPAVSCEGSAAGT